ncbi:hypothetical protein BHE74_00002276 [Ensete ventricosum]|nr:hypothetical protein BHE74_00002276 [Ensete ventricosum]
MHGCFQGRACRRWNTVGAETRGRRWAWGRYSGGELEDDAGDLDLFPPQLVVVGPDENVVKIVIEHRFDDEGNKVRVTTTTRARLSNFAIERRSWPKFGDAEYEDAGARLTMVSTEEILLERPRVAGSILYFLLLFSIIALGLLVLGF